MIEADVFLLTPERPELLPGADGSDTRLPVDGLTLARSEEASGILLQDLRSDRGMGWLPSNDVWFTYLQLREEARDLTYDLALDTADGTPSVVDAGLVSTPAEPAAAVWPLVAIAAGMILILGAAGMARWVMRPASA